MLKLLEGMCVIRLVNMHLIEHRRPFPDPLSSPMHACMRTQVSTGYSVLEAVTARYTGLRGELGEVSDESTDWNNMHLSNLYVWIKS